MNIDLSPIMQAVEDVIARHERYIGYCKAREMKRALRAAQKATAMSQAVAREQDEKRRDGWRFALFLFPVHVARIQAICSLPVSIFCTDKPEIDPGRRRAYSRAKRAATVSINYKGAPGYDVSGLVDRLNSEIKGASIQ